MSAMDGYGPGSYAALFPIPDDAVMRVFDSLIHAYAEETNPEHEFEVNSRSWLGGKKMIDRTSEKVKDRAAWQELRSIELYSAVSKLKEKIRKTDFNVLLKDEKKLKQPDINAMENWIVSVAGRDLAKKVWVEWLEKNPKMNKIIRDAKAAAAEEAKRAAEAAWHKREVEEPARAAKEAYLLRKYASPESMSTARAAIAAAAERDRLVAEEEAERKRAAEEEAERKRAAEEEADAQGVGTLEECKQTLARFKEENARLVDRLAELTGAAVEGGARKRSRKNRRRRSKRTRRH